MPTDFLMYLKQDVDANREAVTHTMAVFITCLRNEELIFTTLAVLLNLCNGFGMYCRAGGR
jgi:hypothetical protein